MSRDEYLSGFLKEDRLIPVVTLVIYFGARGWDGPMSTHEMFGEQDTEVLALVPDYKINLLDPAAIPDKAFDKFHTTMKEVLAFIKYSRNADKLGELIESDAKFRQLGRAEVNVLNTCVNASLSMRDNEEALDVCEAIQEIANRAAEKAKMEAEKEKISTLFQTIKSRSENTGMSIEQLINAADISDSDRTALMQLL